MSDWYWFAAMKYRPEVDGLRAVAVLPVILYHAGLAGFSGGYLGVDIFFVISGYLITTIIVTELNQTGRFSLLHFYERRARRILPALFLTIMMTLLIAPVALTPDQIKDVGQSVAATAVFASNYFFYVEVDYFNPFASMAPLLHTWSLAVEEQFYLVFPLILMAMRWLRISYGLLIGGIIVVSFGAAIWTTHLDPQLSFYSIHTRAWELATGSAVALWLLARDDARTPTTAAWVPPVALVVLLGCLSLMPKEVSHPGMVTLVPVASTAILIATLRPGSVCFRILASPPLVHIGILSYGLYLFHNPVFSFVDVYFDYLGEGTRPYKLALIPVIYLVALTSLHLIERPIRYSKRLGKISILSVSTVALIALFGVGAVIHRQNGFS
ncbi:acyltransferase family protein [Flavimaricola marinus]|uniref:O-acetyltransferase OatA n=1 Tax=Flavimaricola marinus TaxID=1819565 RepID=A0A238LKN1_9RHOB|nr:acyltransferase [Flavimaricola marinus]SMY09945.1 O-acetyltransferase OatA [Flavimaricola marinus]